MPNYILGISAYSSDSFACLLRDGAEAAAASEARFSGKIRDAGFPGRAIEACLRHAGIGPRQIGHVGFHGKPLLELERMLETAMGSAPWGFGRFAESIPAWLGDWLRLGQDLRRVLENFDGRALFVERHESHAASAFFSSPFDEAAILTMEGAGEWATISCGVGRGATLELLEEIRRPHSLGALLSAFASYTGLGAMGPVPSSEPGLPGEPRFVRQIVEELIDLKPDGSFKLNLSYFDPASGMMATRKFERLFGCPPRVPGTPPGQCDEDLARSIHDVCQEVVVRQARTAHARTGMKRLCLAGDVALGCGAGGRLLSEGPFDEVWTQPVAGGAGGALGVALLIHHRYVQQPRGPAAGGESARQVLDDSRQHPLRIAECLGPQGEAPHGTEPDAPPGIASSPPGARELATFGLALAVILALPPAWRLLVTGDPLSPMGFAPAATAAALAILRPAALEGVLRLLKRVGATLAPVNSALFLGLVFWLLVLPTGWLMRLSGRDPLDRRLRDRDSYWHPRHRRADPRRSMEHMF